MTKADTGDYGLRNKILNMLTDGETAKVSTMESSGLVAGDEYLDLEHIEQGVKQVNATGSIGGAMLLPRSAVSNDTWTKIIDALPN